MSPRIAIVIAYFGEWPPWIDFFIESCRANRTIDWLIFGDAPPPANRCRNVHHHQVTFEQYKSLLSDRLGVSVGAADPYKLCDHRPAVGHIHADLLRDYEFVGFGDLDVIYGDIRAFYDDELLGSYDLLSTHRDRVSGHLCLMRNCENVLGAYRQVRGWEKAFSRPDHVGFDEGAFYEHVKRAGAGLFGRGERIRCLFREAYSTPGVTDRMRWYWRDGHLTNEFYPHHPFMYLHFMSWHSSRWIGHQPGVAAGAAAPWTLLPDVIQIEWKDARNRGFMISPQGIGEIDPPRYAPSR